MVTVSKREVKLKSGVVLPAGSRACILVEKENPTVAKVLSEGEEFKMRSIRLGAYYKGFKLPAAKWLDPEREECIVPSLTGAKVEPDGWDSKGFPSIYLAAGLI